MLKFGWSLLLCAASLAPANSATFKVPRGEPIASVAIPDKWRTREFEERVETTSPDGALFFLMMPAEQGKIAESMGEAMRYLRNRGGITIKDNTRKDESGKLNGMETRNVSWQGEDRKGDVTIRFSIVFMTDNKPLIAVYWCSPDIEKKHRSALNKVLQSIKKA